MCYVGSSQCQCGNLLCGYDTITQLGSLGLLVLPTEQPGWPLEVGITLEDLLTIISFCSPLMTFRGLARVLGLIAASPASAGLPAMALPLLVQHFQAMTLITPSPMMIRNVEKIPNPTLKFPHLNLKEESSRYSWLIFLIVCFLSSLCRFILCIRSVKGTLAANTWAARWISVLMSVGIGPTAIIMGASLGSRPVMFSLQVGHSVLPRAACFRGSSPHIRRPIGRML